MMVVAHTGLYFTFVDLLEDSLHLLDLQLVLISGVRHMDIHLDLLDLVSDCL